MRTEIYRMASSMIAGLSTDDGWVDTGLLGMRIRKIAHERIFDCDYPGPLCGLVVDGTKEVVTGDRRLGIVTGDAVLVSHKLPAVSRVVGGSEARPYIGIMLPLDLAQLSALAAEVRLPDADGVEGGAIEAMPATEEMKSAFARLLALSNAPAEAPILAPLIVREIHLRFLLAPRGSVLRALLDGDSQASRISRAIVQMRRNLASGQSIAAFARIAGMGVSAFHAHFKAMTGMAPLAYQKEVRLMHAQNLLQQPGSSVSAVAFAVGYESPTQFSREYSRKFGYSPREERRGRPVAGAGEAVRP